MKIFLFIASVAFLLAALLNFANIAQANEIQGIVDTDNPQIAYPVRDNAFVIILQPVPDNSGDYTMTICNKQSHCRQTSMLSRELRYIGLFIEDMKPVLDFELNRKLTGKQWQQGQNKFRELYTDYMNMYDKIFGVLEVVIPPEVKINVTDVKK